MLKFRQIHVVAVCALGLGFSNVHAGIGDVAVDTVRYVDPSETTSIIGRLVAVEAGVIAAQTTGAIKDMKVNVGDQVKAGDVLAELDGEAQRAGLARAEAVVAQRRAEITAAKASISLATVELKRAAKLRRQSLVAESQYDIKKQALAQAKATLSQAEAVEKAAYVSQLIAQRQLKEVMVRAPYNGVVTKRYTSPGAWVNAGSPVVDLVNNTAMEVEADVPSSRTTELAIGREVTAQFGNITLNMNVRAVIPEENPASRTRVVRFSLVKKSQQLANTSNASVSVNVPVASKEKLLTVHKDALNRSAKGSFVYIVNADGKSEVRPAILGDALGDRYVVKGGLAEGDRAIVKGNEMIGPGMPVRVQ